MSTTFGFVDAVVEADRRLVSSLDLAQVELPPELAVAVGTWKGEPVRIETRAYRGPGVRYARVAELTGADLEIGNVLCLPATTHPLPVLGADLVAVGRGTGMVAADLSPVLPPGPERDEQLAPLAALSRGWLGLPAGGELPGWCTDWFSPHALYTRVQPQQAPEARAALRAIVELFIGLVAAAGPRLDALTATTEMQEGYAAAHRTDDKGLRMLAQMFGAGWAERYLREVLFPPIGSDALSLEVALACDAQGVISWANARAEELLGARAGREMAELAVSGTEGKAQAFLAAAAAGATADWELALLVCGRPATVLARGVPRDGGALVLGSLVLQAYPDTGARAAALVSELGTLHREAERQRRDLAEAQVAREAAEAAREGLLAVIAHDLRTPLTAIMGTADLLHRQVVAGQAGHVEVARRARIISLAATRMNGQIAELLDAARLRAGQPLDLVRWPTDLVKLVRDVAAQAQATTEAHAVEVEAEAHELVGRWDPARLERVLGNLLANAVKYSRGGEVAVRVWREEHGGEAHACVSIRDQGIGIPAADLDRVFGRYERGTNVAGRIAGTGLGLAGANAIVEQHGGTIGVESEEGAGSTFTVRLPL